MQDSAPSPLTDHAASGPRALPIRFAAVDFAAGSTSILSGLGLELSPGGPTLLMGPNGSGKTTVLKLAMGLIEPTSGRITFAGRDRAAPGSRATC